MAEKGDKTTFGAKLDALIGVFGYRLPLGRDTGVYLADKLGITPGHFSRKRNGKAPVSVREYSVIIDALGIGAEVDYRIFDEPDSDAILALMKDSGRGTYGRPQRERLCQRLYYEARDSDHKIKFSRVVNRGVVRGPLGIAQTRVNGYPVLKSGARVEIECNGPKNCHLLVFSANRDCSEVSVLMPSGLAKETRVAEDITILPADKQEWVDVLDDAGEHRLYALWTDNDEIAKAVRDNVSPLKDVKNMDDATANAVVKELSRTPLGNLSVAICEYAVEK